MRYESLIVFLFLGKFLIAQNISPPLEGTGVVCTSVPRTQPRYIVPAHNRPDTLLPEDYAKQQLMNYLYQRLKWPRQIQDRCREGTAIVRVTIDAEGYVCNPQIARDPGCGMGCEALAAVRQLDDGHPRFVPATERGKPVWIYLYIPLRFGLR